MGCTIQGVRRGVPSVRGLNASLPSSRDCLTALRANSPDAHVFCLLHKMDLVDASRRRSVYATRVEELKKKSEGTRINCFATSIWDETIYKVRDRCYHE